MSLWAKHGTETSGLNRVTRPYGPSRAPLCLWDYDSKASPQDSIRSAPPFTTGLYLTYTNKNGISGPPPEPTEYGYTLSYASDPYARRDVLDYGRQPPHHWNSDPQLCLIGEAHATGRSTMGAAGVERWRETATKRWDGVIPRQGGARDAYDEYKGVFKFARHFL